MISSTHIVTGSAIGLAIGHIFPNQWLACLVAFVIGVGSHHLLDLILHTDAGSFRDPDDQTVMHRKELIFALADNILGTTVILFVFFTREASWPMLFGAIGGNFPDVFHHVPSWAEFTRKLKKGKYFKFHETNHYTATGQQIWLGVFNNLALIFGSIWYILSYTLGH